MGAAVTNSTDTRDKVIKLETDMKHLTEQVDSMASKVTAMHELLVQARGLKWLIVTAAAVGGFVSAKIGAFFPWFTLPPR